MPNQLLKWQQTLRFLPAERQVEEFEQKDRENRRNKKEYERGKNRK